MADDTNALIWCACRFCELFQTYFQELHEIGKKHVLIHSREAHGRYRSLRRICRNSKSKTPKEYLQWGGESRILIMTERACDSLNSRAQWQPLWWNIQTRKDFFLSFSLSLLVFFVLFGPVMFHVALWFNVLWIRLKVAQGCFQMVDLCCFSSYICYLIFPFYAYGYDIFAERHVYKCINRCWDWFDTTYFSWDKILR